VREDLNAYLVGLLSKTSSPEKVIIYYSNLSNGCKNSENEFVFFHVLKGDKPFKETILITTYSTRQHSDFLYSFYRLIVVFSPNPYFLRRRPLS